MRWTRVLSAGRPCNEAVALASSPATCNAQATVLARRDDLVPDYFDTTGIEPDFALVK